MPAAPEPSAPLGDDGQQAAPVTMGVVLAYHPADEIHGNIRALRRQVSRIYIVNNSPDAQTAEVLGAIADPAVVVLDQTGNVGVGAGFNAGMRAALAAGADNVWIFDQDSTASDGMLEALIAAQGRRDLAVGIVGPALRAAETGRVYDADRGVGSGENDAVISSGALFSRALLEEIGLHDEALFVDYVDHDISLRAKAAGYTNLKVFDTLLDHRFGDSVPSRFLWRRVYLSNYSVTRQYYMSRNRVVLVRRFGGGRWLRDDLAYAVKAWAKVLLCERDRLRKIGAALRGLRDGLRYREV